MKKTWIRILIVILVILFTWRVYDRIKRSHGKENGRKNRNAAVVVELGNIKYDTVRELGKFSGTLSARSKFNISSKVPGKLEKLTVDIGSIVKKGQIIATLDSDIYEEELNQAKATHAIAVAQEKEADSALKLSDHDLSMQRDLFAKGFISRVEMDNAENQNTSFKAKKEVAHATVKRAEAAVKSAEIQLSYTKIRVSWDDGGSNRIVGERFVDPGVMLTAGTPVLSILDNSIMTAEINVIESDYAKIKLGQEAIITTDAFPEKQFMGKIARIAPELNQESRQARVEIDIPNSSNMLKPGMYAKVFIEFTKHTNAQTIPVAAISDNHGEKGVFLADKKTMTVRFIPIKIGIQQGDIIEVIEPPLSGQVVTLGHDQLADGKKFSLPKSDTQSKGSRKRPGAGS